MGSRGDLTVCVASAGRTTRLLLMKTQTLFCIKLPIRSNYSLTEGARTSFQMTGLYSFFSSNQWLPSSHKVCDCSLAQTKLTIKLKRYKNKSEIKGKNHFSQVF